MTTPSDSSRVAAIRQLCRNAWNWDFAEFCKQTKFDPKFEYATEMFRRFQEAAKLLDLFDDNLLGILAHPPDTSV